MYEKDGKALVAKEVAVKAWGYNKLHGRSLTVLAAMAQYGLINYQSGNLSISEDAFVILEAPNNSPEKKEALGRCAKAPDIFNELYQNYPDRLPSDDTLKWTLKQRGFTEEGAQTTIACLRDTDAFVREQTVTTEGNEVNEVKGVNNQIPPNVLPPQIPPPPPTISGNWSFPLHSGKVASISIANGEPTQEDIDLLKSILEAVKKGLKNAQETK